MTKVSSIIKKYTKKNKQISILYNTKYIDIITKACYVKHEHVDMKNMNIFGCYDTYIVDSNKIDSIEDIYKRYLCKIIVIDDSQDATKKIQLYSNYKKLYNIRVFCPTMEDYLSGYNTYDGYLDTKKMDDIFIS